MGAIYRLYAVMGEVVMECCVYVCVCVCVFAQRTNKPSGRVRYVGMKFKSKTATGCCLMLHKQWQHLNKGAVWKKYCPILFVSSKLFPVFALQFCHGAEQTSRRHWQHNTPKTLSTTQRLFKINHSPQITLSCFSHQPCVQLFVILSCKNPTPYNTTDRSE